MNVIGVRKHRSTAEQSLETSLAELILESHQVIISKLVDHYAYDQADLFRRWRRRRFCRVLALLRVGDGNGKDVRERENETEGWRKS